MRLRGVFSAVLAAAVAVSLMPLGCGAAQEEYTVVHHPQKESSSSSEWTVPEVVVEQLRACVKEHAGDLKTYAHQAKFDLAVTEQGHVQRIELRNSTLHHEAMESCMTQVLATLSIPPSVIPLRSSEPVSGGESMRRTNEPGIVQVIAGVSLAPIILVAAGVTLTVYVAVAVGEETLEAVKRRRKREVECKQIKQQCIEYCSDTTLPTRDYGWQFQKCKNECLERNGCPRDS